MYLASIVLLLAVFPILSIVAELFVFPSGADAVIVIARWFVFWTVGLRLGLAGVRQMANPEFTASTIFRIQDRGAQKIVRELGFANLAMGVIGTLSIVEHGWVIPAGVAGTIYYGLAGLLHTRSAERSKSETIALVSDFLIFVVLGVFVGLAWAR